MPKITVTSERKLKVATIINVSRVHYRKSLVEIYRIEPVNNTVIIKSICFLMKGNHLILELYPLSDLQKILSLPSATEEEWNEQLKKVHHFLQLF